MGRDRSSSNPPMTTPLQALVANDTTTALFNALTPAMDTTGINNVRVSYWLDSSLVAVKTAVQFSDDGVNWTDSAIAIGSSFESDEGWTHPDAWEAIFDLTGTKRLYCRFGLLAVTQSGTDTSSGIAALSIDFRRVAHRSVRIPPTRVQTDGTTTQMFNPLTGAIGVEQFKEIRATTELGTNTGNIQVQPAWQVSDTPEDWSSWSAPVPFGTNVTSESIDFATVFESAVFEGAYARFGTLCENTSTGAHELCRTNLRIDLRSCSS